MSQRCKITREQYEALVEAYRQAPGSSPSHIAAKCSTTKETAKKAWVFGWPHVNYRPISQVIAEEQLELRARMVAEKDRADGLEAELEAKRRMEVRSRAITDATETNKAELQMVRLARGASTQVLATLTSVAAGAAKLGGLVRTSLEKRAQEIDPATGQVKEMSPAEAAHTVRLLNALTTSLRQANEAARSSMDMERTLAGMPTSIVGHVHVGPMSVDEAERRITQAARMLERAKARGIVVEGGSLEGGPMPALAPVAGGT